MPGMSRPEIAKLMTQYIGVVDHRIRPFTQNNLGDFFAGDCELDVNSPANTTSVRKRFQDVIEDASPEEQARIIRGVIKRCPPDIRKFQGRTEDLRDELLDIARRLDGASPVRKPTLKQTSKFVEQAIGDVEELIERRGGKSAVDRVHSALHGHLRAICESKNIPFGPKDTMTVLFNAIQTKHPAFSNMLPNDRHVLQIFKALGEIMDVLNPIRNSRSMAHPTKVLLDPPEAMLVVNTAKSILHYLDGKIRDAKP